MVEKRILYRGKHTTQWEQTKYRNFFVTKLLSFVLENIQAGRDWKMLLQLQKAQRQLPVDVYILFFL